MSKDALAMTDSVVVLAYNFPHRKTQDFLFRLFAEGIRVEHVLAADPVKLNVPPSSIRSKLRHGALIDPEKVAKAIGANYHVVPHQGDRISTLLDEIKPTIGVISGARILKRPVIDRFSTGIINFHPGLIPEVRGLDAFFWSICKDVPLGVTSHLIDHRVDAGRILERREIPLGTEDTIFDLSERLYETQIEMLVTAIGRARAGEWEQINYESTEYNRKMPAELEAEIVELLPAYLEHRAND